MFLSTFFNRLARAFSAGVREFQNEEDIDPCPDIRSFKNWDLESKVRALEVKLDRSVIPEEGIEGRDKWLKENFQINVAERVIAALNSAGTDDGCFNSLDALLTLNKPVPPENMDMARRLTEEEIQGNYWTKMEEKFVKRVGKDGGDINWKLRKEYGVQRMTMYARAEGFCCKFRYDEWRYYQVIVPEKWHCCEKGEPAEWELTWMKDQVESARESWGTESSCVSEE